MDWNSLLQKQDETLQHVLKELHDIKYALDQASIVAITDQRGSILYANEQFCKISRYEQSELIGQDHRILNSGYHPAEFFRTMWATIGSGRIWRGEVRNRAKDGSFYWVDTTIIPFLNDQGKPYQYVSIRNDITQRKQMEEEIKKSEEKYRLITENTSDLIAVIDRDGTFSYLSPSHQVVLGYEPAEMMSGNLLQWVLEADRDAVEEVIHTVLVTKKASQVEFRIPTKSGSAIDMDAKINPILNQSGNVKDLVLVLRDITERKKSEQTIYHLAYHDTLTELPNRRLFIERLHKEINQAKRIKSELAVMFLDMDRFKDINDTWGHDVGDLILIEAAKRLKRCVRSEDVVARLGGDEFTVLLANISRKEEVSAVAERVIAQFQKPLEWMGHQYNLSCSIGIAMYPADAANADDLLKRADTALYAVKSRGRNEYEFFTPAMEAKSLERILLENELRKAIEHEQFRLYYQPKMDLTTGELIGMEALVRWVHPELGLIAPGKFIPLAEECGLIIPLGEWILRHACEQNKAWQENGYPPLKIAVNMSAQQFQQKNLLEMVRGILEETRLAPEWLELEITESIFLNSDNATAILQNIRELGVQVSIDDFGTGYSSFSYIKDLPIDTIKIDASFIRDLHHNKESQAIVKAILTIAQSLNLNVVAEGVETGDQLNILNGDGCAQGQGYYFSQPLASQEFEEYLRAACQPQA
ncbi:EAL domain-containing protein [Brevibacillus sp. B_LB10_24]|uniref:sensor domain-containing protein n=1 Tax=Brevibacillus sp. B_LB10_24 TaxID=3380645 RepID=UPI0038BC8B39